jgi:ecotin
MGASFREIVSARAVPGGKPRADAAGFRQGGNMFKASEITCVLLLFAASTGHAQNNLRAFPPAGEGMVRHVLQLPEKTEEEEFRVELIVGKVVRTDARNKYFFGGKIEEETIKGWGFTLYRVTKFGPMAGTLMAVDPNEPKVSRFIALAGGPYLIRYNSRLPIVVYAPDGVDVRYRIWSAGSEVKTIPKG